MCILSVQNYLKIQFRRLRQPVVKTYPGTKQSRRSTRQLARPRVGTGSRCQPAAQALGPGWVHFRKDTGTVPAIPRGTGTLGSGVIAQAWRGRQGLCQVASSKDKPVSVPASFTTRSLREEVWTLQPAQRGAAVRACGEKSAHVALDRG